MEKIYMAHGIPHNRVRNQAIHVPDGADKSSEKQGPPLHLEGHRCAYNPHQWLVMTAGVVGFVAIATFTGGTGWLLERLSYAIEQNTRPLQDEERKIGEAAIRYRAETAYDTPWMQRARQKIDSYASSNYAR